MVDSTLRARHATWQEKPALRAVYTDLYKRIAAACRPGLSLEIGGGSGNFREFSREVISTDIVPEPWLDAAADAQSLPFRDASFANIVGVDVLHHIERPRRFFLEAQRVLQLGGRIILVEPAITPLSWVFYRLFHPEPVTLRSDPLEDGPLDPNRAPFDANQAIPTLLLGRYRARMMEEFPSLVMADPEWMSFLAYPLSGGFRRWSLIPSVLVKTLLDLERSVPSWIGEWIAFRLMAVIEKADR